MKRIGMCWRCLEWKEVRDHHAFGYGTDEVVPYCQSCDKIAHYKAIREGRCNLSPDERRRKSNRSSVKRTTKVVAVFRETVGKNVRLYEKLQMNLNTGAIYVISGFIDSHDKKLCVIEEQ